MGKGKRLMEASWWERLTEGETGSSFDGLSKSFTDFRLKGWAVFSPCYFTWGRTMVGVMKIMATSFKRSKASPATLSAPKPAAGRCRPVPPWRLPCTHRHVWASVLWGHGSFLLGPGVHKVLFVLSKGLFPVLCKFWRLYGGVNGDLLQEGLCHTQVYCTQSPCYYTWLHEAI